MAFNFAVASPPDVSPKALGVHYACQSSTKLVLPSQVDKLLKRQVPKQAPSFSLGSGVWARYPGGNYFEATIAALCDGHSVTVDWADKDSRNRHITRTDVRQKQKLLVGDLVAANYATTGEMFTATIAELGANGAVIVTWKDGDEAHRNVHQKDIVKLEPLAVNDHVSIFSESRQKWFDDGVVTEVSVEGVMVRYASCSKEILSSGNELGVAPKRLEGRGISSPVRQTKSRRCDSTTPQRRRLSSPIAAANAQGKVNACRYCEDMLLQRMPWIFRVEGDDKKAIRVLCYGDSLTAGFCNFGSTFEPYGRWIAKSLLEAETACDIMVCGLTGATAEEMLQGRDLEHLRDSAGIGHTGQGLARILADAARKQVLPHAVLILAGTNDLGHVGCTPGVNVQSILARIREMHSICHQRGVATIAFTPPCLPSGQWREAQMQLKPQLEAWSRSESQVLAHFDVEDLVPRSFGMNLWDRDQLHMSSAGQRRFGELLAQMVPPLLGKH